MRFLKLTLTNFKSFVDKTVIPLSERTGFIYLYGENGEGKSSVFDGLFWCLYGKTSRNLKAGNVRSWGTTKGCSGVLEFEYLGDHYVLARTWKPNSLTLVKGVEEPRTVAQEELDALIGLSPELFLHTVYHSQFGRYFLELGATEQLDLFSSGLDLDVWEQAAERASIRGREYETSLNSLKQNLSRLQGRLTELNNQLEREEEREHMELRERYWSAYLLQDEIKNYQAQLEKLPPANDNALRHKLDLGLKAENKLETELNKLKLMQNQNANDIRKLKKEIETSKTAKVCPTCGQPIKSNAEQHLAESKSYLRNLEELDTNLVSSIEESIQKCGAMKKKNQLLQDRYDHEVGALIQKRSRLEGNIAAARRQLKSAVRNSPQFDSAKFVEEVEDARCEVGTYKKEVLRMSEVVEGARYWVKAFKEIRLQMIENYLAQLEIETNSALQSLGLGDWALIFSIEQLNKSGTLKRGFTVLVESPLNTEPVPWESWSGGEAQRLKLAAEIGLATVLNDHKNLDFNLEIWDEPSNFLNEDGLDQLLDVLQHRSNRFDHSVWLVDHRVFDRGVFTEAIRIVKTGRGSKIRYS